MENLENIHLPQLAEVSSKMPISAQVLKMLLGGGGTVDF